MSTVKLITPYNAALHELLKDFPVRIIVIDEPRIDYDALARAIFNPYKGKLVIFGPIEPGYLPVNSSVYRSAEDIASYPLDNAVGRVIHNVSTRTYSEDNKVFYDVYKVWHECRTLTPVKKSVKSLLMKMYKTDDAREIAPWYGGKTIGKMTEADDDYRRIYSADLHYPIIMRWGCRSVDGLHRLMQCALTGRKHIDVIVIPYGKLYKCRIVGDVESYHEQF